MAVITNDWVIAITADRIVEQYVKSIFFFVKAISVQSKSDELLINIGNFKEKLKYVLVVLFLNCLLV